MAIVKFKILLMDPANGQEELREYRASSLSEALMMAERETAARSVDRLRFIRYEDYQLARVEGIEFNEADGAVL